MSSSFEYLDIILLAMIAGFIILRLRGILGRRTGHKKKVFGDPFSKKVIQKDTEKKVVPGYSPGNSDPEINPERKPFLQISLALQILPLLQSEFCAR